MEKLNQSILLELASELADARVKEEFKSPLLMDSNEVVIYREDAQDYFNEMYDYYLSIIEDVIK